MSRALTLPLWIPALIVGFVVLVGLLLYVLNKVMPDNFTMGDVK